MNACICRPNGPTVALPICSNRSKRDFSRTDNSRSSRTDNPARIFHKYKIHFRTIFVPQKWSRFFVLCNHCRFRDASFLGSGRCSSGLRCTRPGGEKAKAARTEVIYRHVHRGGVDARCSCTSRVPRGACAAEERGQIAGKETNR